MSLIIICRKIWESWFYWYLKLLLNCKELSFSPPQPFFFHCWQHVYFRDCPINLHVGKHPHFLFHRALTLGAKFWTRGALFACLFDKESYLGTEVWSASLAFPEIYALWGRHLFTLVVILMCYHEHDCMIPVHDAPTTADTMILSFTS